MNRKVTSPCVNICSIDDETGCCKGCLRTLEEIANWMNYTEEQRMEILEEIKERRI